MRNLIPFWAITLLTISIATSAQAQTCKIADSTGPLLNVRHSAAGKVLSQIPNGRMVYIANYDHDSKGKSWVLIHDAITNEKIGWVFRDAVNCYQTLVVLPSPFPILLI